MRVSLDWIKDFVDIKAAPEEVAHRLTMAGLEIEGMESLDGDVIMEVNVTPNRPDCLNILGIAREVAAAFDLPLRIPGVVINAEKNPSDVQVEIDSTDLCGRYTGRSITCVEIKDSPEWMKKRLEKCGIRSINNVVDITNYVLLEFGHPLHAFDADRIRGKKIRVDRAGKSRNIVTLDGVERTLSEDTLLIWDGKGPVAVAGIMGGEGSSVDEHTKNVFLESAYFNPSSIRKSSKTLGLKSESSYRFERGTDILFLESALNRATLLIQELAGGTISDIVDEYPGKYKQTEITVQYRKVNSLLGTELENDRILRILERIGIRTKDRGDSFIVYPPAFRGDIREPVDIIEEVARCYGYDKIPVRIPKTVLPDGILNMKERTVQKIRETIRKAGFNEVINFSFMNSADLDMLSIPEHEERRKYIALMNPLRQEECLMRTTLVPSLINNFLYNLSRDVRDIRLFELARVFVDSGGQLPEEGLRLGGIYFQDNAPVIWKDSSPSFYVVKGAIECLFDEMKIREYSFKSSEQVFLHKGKSADIILGEKNIGFIGELGPNIVERLDLKIQRPEIVVFELDADELFSLIPEKMVFSQIPKYPFIQRDIALIIDKDMTSAEVMDVLHDYKSEFIEKVELFDYYKGKNIPQDKKSLAFRVIYRSRDRTLTDSEVESVHHSLTEYITKKTGGEIRGQC